MKKIMLFMVAAVATLSLVSCGGKTNGNTAELDSLATETTEAEVTPVEQAQKVVALLQEQIKNADPEQIKAIGSQVAEKVAEFIAKGDEAAAKAYTETINQFISENAETLKAIGASTTIAEALSNVENLPSSLLESVNSAATGVATTADEQVDAAKQAVDAAKAAVEAAPEAAKQAAEEAASAAKAKVEEEAAAAQQKAQEKASQAIDDAAAAAKKKLGL